MNNVYKVQPIKTSDRTRVESNMNKLTSDSCNTHIETALYDSS